MKLFYMILAFARPLIFIAAVIGFTVLMIKIARNNAKRRSDAINQLIDITVNRPDAEYVSATKDNVTVLDENKPKIITPKRINIEELDIPADFMFKEEFEILKYMAVNYPNDFKVFLYEPVSITAISMCEERMGISFSDELKALYTFTNGMGIGYYSEDFYNLEQIESMYETGYCDFEKEGDAKDYVIVGAANGCGDPIVMEKSTGELFSVDHEIGEKSESYTVNEYLYEAIEYIADDLEEDEIINKYLRK